jgi:hypothetical protein
MPVALETRRFALVIPTARFQLKPPLFTACASYQAERTIAPYCGVRTNGRALLPAAAPQPGGLWDPDGPQTPPARSRGPFLESSRLSSSAGASALDNTGDIARSDQGIIRN